jgi:hypothetical protein
MTKTELAAKASTLRDLTERAQRGDATALPELREFFTNPEMVDLTGDLAGLAQRTLVAKLCGNNLLAKEGLTRKMKAMRADLAGPNPTPVERLLVERVVACWLHLSHLEAIYSGQDGMDLPLAMHYERRITLAQKRYLTAIKTLAQVRKLHGLVLDVPREADAPATRATVSPPIRRAANAPAGGKLSGR